MTIYTRPDELVFAESANPGEVVAFPDIPRGWGVAFDQTEGKPPMEWFNDILRRQDRAIRYLLQRGLSEWSETEDYPAGARLQHNGVEYSALVANVGIEPGTSTITWLNAQKGRLLNVQIFDTPGTFTYTPTAGTTKVRVRVIGGGGGGGGVGGATAAAWGAAAGGAAGAYSESLLTGGFAAQNIIVGSGGAGAAAGNNAGSNGGTSSFGALLTATGGGGGLGQGSSDGIRSVGGGEGGIASGGQINAQGNGGGTSIMTSGQGYQSGIGAGSFYGGGANSRRSGNQGAGINGTGPGSGGSGASAGGGGVGGLTGNFAGGRGADGIIVIEEFS